MLDWLIIGGGIHGTYLGRKLLQQGGIPRDGLRLLDPHAHLIGRWSRLTANTGMQHLRSPHAHHLAEDVFALHNFAKSYPLPDVQGLIAPHQRPAYALFQAHAQHVITQCGLQDLHLRGAATALEDRGTHWHIESDAGQLSARHVVLAIGRTGLNWPAWTQYLRDDARLQHVLSEDFNRDTVTAGERVVIVGGGVSAGQLALYLQTTHGADVTLLVRAPLKQVDYDSSPCWLSPGCLTPFARADYDDRRWMIGEARQTGTLTREVFRDINAALADGTMSLVEDDVTSAQATENGIKLLLKAGGTLHAQQVICATGFQKVRPGAAWVDALIKRYALPVYDDGYPLAPQRLEWGRRLYITGALAELEIGPAAPNIAGARLAAERIIAATR